MYMAVQLLRGPRDPFPEILRGHLLLSRRVHWTWSEGQARAHRGCSRQVLIDTLHHTANEDLLSFDRTFFREGFYWRISSCSVDFPVNTSAAHFEFCSSWSSRKMVRKLDWRPAYSPWCHAAIVSWLWLVPGDTLYAHFVLYLMFYVFFTLILAQSGLSDDQLAGKWDCFLCSLQISYRVLCHVWFASSIHYVGVLLARTLLSLSIVCWMSLATRTRR